MRNCYKFIIVLTFLTSYTFGQKFDVDTIYNSGPVASRINFVILPDGYQANEMDKFRSDVQGFIDKFLSTPPYTNYRHYFNFYAVRVPSLESGADHPGTALDVSEPVQPVIAVNNYFSSTFDYSSIHRLVLPTDFVKVYQVVADNFPLYDHIIVLVNSEYYGGSGGAFSTATTHSLSAEVVMHELGHSFGLLSDEYYAGDGYAGESVNMTKETDPDKVKWKNWLGTDNVGIYQHCCGGNSAQWYRPHQNCKMRVLNAPFCPVCTQALIEKIHALAPALESYFPAENNITVDSGILTFHVQNIPIEPNTLKVSWEVNGKSLSNESDTLLVSPDDLNPGDNKITVYVEDTTDLIRIDNHHTIHTQSVSWLVQKNTSGSFEISSEKHHLDAQIYPNPTTDELHISVTGWAGGQLSIIIRDEAGKVKFRKNPDSGNNLKVNVSSWSPGPFFIEFYSGRSLVGVRKIIVE